MPFLKRLLAVKDALGQSQKDLANSMGVRPQALSNLIARGGLPGTSALIALKEDVTNVDMNWLFSGEGNMFISQNKSEDSELISEYEDLISSQKAKIKSLDETNELLNKEILDLERHQKTLLEILSRLFPDELYKDDLKNILKTG